MAFNEQRELGLLETSAVKEMANIGLGSAMTALSQMTGRFFNMTIPRVETVNLDDIPDLMGDPMGVAVGIYMPVEGDVEGHMGFLFPWDSACELWKMLVGTSPETPGDVEELHASVALEIGNIINSSFLNAISDMTGLKLHATPPLVSLDLTASIASSIVVEALTSEVVALAIETQLFEIERESVTGFFVFIPTLDGLTKLFQGLGIPEAA